MLCKCGAGRSSWGQPRVSQWPTEAEETGPVKLRLASSSPEAQLAPVAFALVVLHILFVQKPRQEGREEALMTRRLGWVLPGLVVTGGTGWPGKLGQEMSQTLTVFSLVT